MPSSAFDPLWTSIEARIVAVQELGAPPLFRLMRLRPPHGWPAVWWELTIVTVGVLIALTADQVVRALHSRATVAEFRRAADKEIAFNLAALEYRLGQERCLQKRLSDLASWRDGAGRGRSLQGEIGRPPVVSFRTSVWNARSDAVSAMPLDARLAYSELYDVLGVVWWTIDAERDVWRSLAAFNGAEAASPEGRMRLNELLYRAKSLAWVLRVNWPLVRRYAAELSITPSFGANAWSIPPPDLNFCVPLIPQISAAQLR